MLKDELFSKLYENASTRKKKTLELINNACKKRSESDIKDFSIGTIARLIAVQVNRNLETKMPRITEL